MSDPNRPIKITDAMLKAGVGVVEEWGQSTVGVINIEQLVRDVYTCMVIARDLELERTS